MLSTPTGIEPIDHDDDDDDDDDDNDDDKSCLTVCEAVKPGCSLFSFTFSCSDYVKLPSRAAIR